MVDVLAKLQAAAPLTREAALEEEAARAIAERAEKQAAKREQRTSGNSRKRYQKTASGLRYTIAGTRVNSVDDVKAIIPKIVSEYGVSRSEAKRIAHKMLHAEENAVAESKRAVKAAAKKAHRETGYDANHRIPTMPSGNKDRMKWDTRDSRHVQDSYLVLRTLAGITLQNVKLAGKISRLDISTARPERIYSK